MHWSYIFLALTHRYVIISMFILHLSKCIANTTGWIQPLSSDMDFFNINKFSVYSILFNVIHWLMPSKLCLCLLVLYVICVVAWSCPGSMWSGEIFVKRSSNIGWIVFWLRLEALTRCLGWVLLTEWDYLSVVGCVVWMTVVTGWVVRCIGDTLTHYTQYIYRVFSWKTRVAAGHKKALKCVICILENIRL